MTSVVARATFRDNNCVARVTFRGNCFSAWLVGAGRREFEFSATVGEDAAWVGFVSQAVAQRFRVADPEERKRVRGRDVTSKCGCRKYCHGNCWHATNWDLCSSAICCE